MVQKKKKNPIIQRKIENKCTWICMNRGRKPINYNDRLEKEMRQNPD